uniref:SUEL-type lectin domain-containing protein n=1 Tax=Tetradesmus obliquus TaxID=3088 RepID=A0A383WK88_TETOB|eukprot:jgi/Sobl393_1/10870/SZX77544.1
MLPDFCPGITKVVELSYFCKTGSHQDVSCGPGLVRNAVNSSSQLGLCVTMPGHGYAMTIDGAFGQPCPPGWFSPGGNTLPCMECPSALDTDDNRTACANTSTGNTSAATEAPTTISSQLCADSGMLYTLQCPPNTTITITSVHYGRPSATACPGPGGFCAGADVTALFTQKLQSTCAGIPDCTFHLDDLMLPDICPYIRKVAELTYFCKAGSHQNEPCGPGLVRSADNNISQLGPCVTLPGHGYAMTIDGAFGQPCPPGWFSPGGNTLPCMECPSGLDTDDNRTACGEDVMAQA